jgi:hypothetical protein
MQKTTSVVVTMALAFSLAAPGCASSTTITSNPEGAQLTIDGQLVGPTPVTFSKASVWAWTKHQVKLELAGYETRTGFVSATISPVHLAIGIICFIPLLPLAFVGQYEPRYHFELVRKNTLAANRAWEENVSVKFEQ